jgi:hypothetical protein
LPEPQFTGSFDHFPDMAVPPAPTAVRGNADPRGPEGSTDESDADRSIERRATDDAVDWLQEDLVDDPNEFDVKSNMSGVLIVGFRLRERRADPIPPRHGRGRRAKREGPKVREKPLHGSLRASSFDELLAAVDV